MTRPSVLTRNPVQAPRGFVRFRIHEVNQSIAQRFEAQVQRFPGNLAARSSTGCRDPGLEASGFSPICTAIESRSRCSRGSGRVYLRLTTHEYLVMTLRWRLILPTLILGLLPSTGLARERWIRLNSPNFETVSNASEKKSRTLIRELEQFRHVFSELFHLTNDRVPVTVFIFRNDKSFTPFKPSHEGKPASVAGFFQGGRDRNVIALNVAANENPLHVIFHEYVHLLTSDTPYPWPLWVKEGLAEFYSTFQVRGRELKLGGPIPRHAETLRRARMYSVENLFSIDHDSSEYNETRKQGVFYAQSWALVHYLMLHEKAKLRPQFVRFVQLLWRGVEPVEAFQQAIEVPFKALQSELQKYVRQHGLYSQVFRLEVVPAAEKIDVAELNESKRQAHLGDLFYYTGRLEEAQVRYKEARRLDPPSLPPREGLALIALREEDRETARGLLEETSEGGSRSYLVHYYYAEMLMDEVSRQSELSRAEFESISRPLREAVELAPAFDRPYYLLGRLYRQWGRDLDEGLGFIDRALVLKPRSDYYRMTRADLLLARQDYDAAEQLFRDLAESDEEGIRQYAQRSLEHLTDLREQQKVQAEATADRKKLLSELKRRGESEKVAEEVADSSGERTKSTHPPALRSSQPEKGSQSESEESGLPQHQCKPTFASVSGLVPMEGHLRRVDCSTASIQYVVEIDGQEVHTIGVDPTQPVLFSCSVHVQEMRCGAFSHDAVVYFEPGQERDPETGALRVVAIEFR